ncbi:hypothetical protein [Luteimonas sp. 100069]|uniref:hypothetical protein n=1 Tax=Luteimonas sp. 100069 TaxID=2006109 RepID=UPI000F50C0C3|nr:hypothetical protein [Luteimonas sp. 100069]RPD85176.1 hypothetical protein EGK76_09635 [Luteimonas sp. 100069]
MPICNPGRLGLLAAAVLALAGCGGEDTPAASGPQIIAAPPPPEALPDCAAIATALGDLVEGLVVVDEAGTRQQSPENYDLSCVWRGSEDGAALGTFIIVDQVPLTATDMQRAGMYVEDPRVSPLGGFVAIPDGLLDGNAPLGPVGPQVIVGPVTVTLASNGRGRAAEYTLDQAVDAAVAIHRLMR